jgi:hypothetical protein
MISVKGGKSLMAKGQNKRQIGKGMKPRGNKRFKPQKETEEMTEQSTVEGQQTPVPEAILEPEEGNETPGNLESKNGEESFQNLESPEKIVAHDEGLEAALNQSAGEQPQSQQPQLQETVIKGKEYSIGVDTGLGGDYTVSEPRPAGDHHAVGEDEAPELQSPLGGMAIAGIPALGLQPDGSKVYPVKVEEAYWAAVEDWARGDGISPEEWLKNLLYSAISIYGEPAKGR